MQGVSAPCIFFDRENFYLPRDIDQVNLPDHVRDCFEDEINRKHPFKNEFRLLHNR